MTMYFNGIDFPNQIIDSIKSNRLVVFAGAGVSTGKPTSLPNFYSLAIEVAKETGEEIRRKDSCEAFLGKLKTNGIEVNNLAASILSDVCLKYNRLHEAIIDLFISQDDIKIVTTNYDKMFEQVLDKKGYDVPIYNAPALPLGNDIKGIIHVHGNVDEPKYMVLTDEDFGHAYLTEGYASKFLIQLFQSYTVLFIGYSYNDIILRYLTRALYKRINNNIYILTDDTRDDWSILGIKTVYYPKRSHKVMREGLIKLGKFSKRGLIDWKMRLETMSEFPPKDLIADLEIEYCLEDIKRIRILASSIRGKEWMEFLERKGVFSDCFCDGENKEKCEVWSEWLCKNFVGKDDESLLRLIYRNNISINKDFTETLFRSLIHNKSITTNHFVEYVIILEKDISDKWITNMLIEKLVDREQYYYALLLYERLFDYHMILEKRGWFSDDFEYKHVFLGDYYYINTAWKLIKNRVVERYSFDVLLFVTERINDIHNKYEMLGQASSNTEPRDMLVIDLEDRKQFWSKNVLCILSKMMVEAACSLQEEKCDLLKSFLLKSIDSDSLLMRRIALKAIRETRVFDTSEKLELLINNHFIDPGICKEQVFLLVKNIYGDLKAREKNCLIDTIEEIDTGIEDRDNLYKIYNWCIWLNQLEPTNERVDSIINKFANQYGFKPREHPELTMWNEEVKWIHNDSPVSEDELKELDEEKVVKYLVNYNEHPIEGESREGLLDTYSACISKDYDWAKRIIERLLDNKIDVEDVWHSTLSAINTSEYNLEDAFYILRLLTDNIEYIGDVKGISEYLQKLLERKGIKDYFIQNEKEFYVISEKLWKIRNEEEYSGLRLIDLTLNTIIGHLLFSWIYMASFFDEDGIPQKYEKKFEETLKLETWERKVAVCILAGNFNFFCFRDKEWTEKILVPLLVTNDKKSFTNAWEGMAYYSRNISVDTADVIVPLYYSALCHVIWLEDEALNGFIETLLTLMIYFVERPTLKFIPEFYKNMKTDNRKMLIDIMGTRLSNMNEKNKKEWWHSWLKRFVENRKNNKPCKLEEDENKSITELILDLPEVFEDGVNTICKGEMPKNIDSVFWYRLYDMNIAKQQPNSMAKLLTNLLSGVDSISSNGDYIIKIVEELVDLKPKEKSNLQEALLGKNIDVVVM